jgi:hypothetical protein
MNAFLATIITGSTLLKLVVGALVAGLGVTVSFSLLIICVDRASAMRRADQPTMALLFQAASVLALALVFAIIAYGLILTVSKPK